ncbi:MAG: DUF4145 domain-containing protein [Candidatus Omnitrophica bacterium]|nr:DUF4145 domain-containing protein [Candidatus Omnitrophota bacterium]
MFKGKNVKLINPAACTGINVRLRCPVCGHLGTFERVKDINDLMIHVPTSGALYLGERSCPNIECSAVIFFIRDTSGYVVSYPPQRIDFNKEGIPENVKKTLEEAIECHANQCYTASAMMIRKTLEEICEEKGAKGEDLQKRIKDLSSKIIIPKELLEGMDELRLLGNDATHIESRLYENIEKEEVDVAIEFAKEILKAVYQYEHLLGRLRNLKKK